LSDGEKKAEKGTEKRERDLIFQEEKLIELLQISSLSFSSLFLVGFAIKQKNIYHGCR
jgi:hypothetical protein